MGRGVVVVLLVVVIGRRDGVERQFAVLVVTSLAATQGQSGSAIAVAVVLALL
jgi:hypothetical protein